jgi:hypothetical protein
MSRRIALASALLCVAGYVFVYAAGRANPPIRGDGYGHYVYLPAWFIYGDVTLSAVARDCCGGEFPPFTAINRWPGTQRWVNVHPIGVALLQTPFFVLGHGLTTWSNLSPDGFTLYYQHAAGLAGVFWAVAGLFVLRRFLLRHFSDGVTGVTLAALLFGTNLYHYATYDSGYSHAYSFFLFGAFLDLTDLWTTRGPSFDRAALLGLVAGLIVLTRHPNGIFLAVLPLYGVTDLASARARASQLLARWRELALMAAVGLLVLAPQLAIYRDATGRFLVSSYGNWTFNFLSPQVSNVLFSVRKGLFFWSPLLLAAVAGFFLRCAGTRAFAAGAAFVLLAHTYLIASWWDWQYGAGYGHRGFTDAFPLFALGLAAFFEWTAARVTRTRVVAAAATLAVVLSVVQMLQYWNGVMPMADVTWEQYRSVFLRFDR